MHGKDLSILIVTYNSRPLIDALLDGLTAQIAGLGAGLGAGLSVEVVLMDNAAHDGTADAMAVRHPAVRLLRSPRNLGFAAGNNLAAAHAQGRMLLLLKADALPEPDCVARGLAPMDAHPGVGLAGARLLAENRGTQPSARMFPTLTQEAFMLIRRSLFDSLGGFDERFFLYYEEVDLCRRVKEAGCSVIYWPELRVGHIGGVSARTVAGATVARAGSQLTLWCARSGLLYGFLVIARGHHQHGDLPAQVVARPLQQVGADAVGQHPVDEQEVEAFFLQRFDGGGRRSEGVHAVPGTFEPETDDGGLVRVVFRDADVHGAPR